MSSETGALCCKLQAVATYTTHKSQLTIKHSIYFFVLVILTCSFFNTKPIRTWSKKWQKIKQQQLKIKQ